MVTSWISNSLADLSFAIRILRKNPSRTVLLVGMLGLGIGINTGVYSVIHSVFLDPLPFRDSSRLMTLHQANRSRAGGVSYPNFQDWRAAATSFESMSVYTSTSAVLADGGATMHVYGAIASANLFETLGVPPLRGRTFLAAEDRWGGSLPVVISDRLWRSRFHGTDDVIGQYMRLDSEKYRVIGVIDARMAFPVQNDAVDYWTTVAVDGNPAFYGGTTLTSRAYPRYDAVIARLKSGVTPQQAQAEMGLIAQGIAREHPKATSQQEVSVTPALEDLVGEARPMFLLLYGGVLSILLIACANAAVLLLVAAKAREKEFAVRAALGARSGRLIRQLLMESLVVALSGGAAGVLIASWVVALFVRIAPADTARLANVQVDGTLLLYAVGVSLATGIVFGLAPAISAARTDLATRMKNSAFRSGNLLVGGQVALSLALTCCAAVLIASFIKILDSPKGFDPSHILTASITLPGNSSKAVQFYEGLLARVRTMPGVESASVAQTLPLSGTNNNTSVQVVGHPEPGKPSADLRFVESNYFATLKIPMVAGRVFDPSDTAQRPPIAVVNQAFVNRYLQGRQAIGSKVMLGWGGDNPKEIVGVIGDVRHNPLATQVSPEVYVPQAQFPLNDMVLVVRTVGAPEGSSRAIRESIAAMDSSIPVERVRTLEAYLLLSVAPQRFLMWVLAAFSGSALLLAAIGLYGVLSYSAERRTREFGIRMALGSTRSELIGLVLSKGMAIGVGGAGAGLILAVASTRFLSRWLFQTSPLDPLSLIGAAAVLLVIAIPACLVPAMRAAAVDPLTSLRAD